MYRDDDYSEDDEYSSESGSKSNTFRTGGARSQRSIAFRLNEPVQKQGSKSNFFRLSAAISKKSSLKCSKILSAYRANVPPQRYKPKALGKKSNVMTRGLVKLGKTETIKNSTLPPKGALPPNALDTWKELPPDVKLPDIRDQSGGTIYYTRGRLGQKLHREKQDFDVSDPYNRRTVLDTKEYSALHDPYCKNYFKQPTVQKHLRNQNLINDKKEVICNVHEFNQYRTYLGSLFNGQVRRRIQNSDEMRQMEKSLQKDIQSVSDNPDIRQSKWQASKKMYQERHKVLNRIYTTTRQKRYEAKIERWEKQIKEIDLKKIELQLARTGEYTYKHWNAHMTRQNADKQEAKRKKECLTRIAYAQIKNEYVTKYDKFVRLALFERFKADQAAIMIARDDQIDDMEQLVEETQKRSRAAWLEKYKNYIGQTRNTGRNSQDELLLEEKRKLALARKYFNIWRRNVIKRRSTSDSKHYTSFNVNKKLRPYVAAMKELYAPEHQKDECHENAYNNVNAKGSKSKGVDGTNHVPGQAGDHCKHVGVVFGHHHRKYYHKHPTEHDLHKKKRKRHFYSHAHVDGEMDLDEGNEADLDEADEYIDKIVSTYLLGHNLLKTKLKGVRSEYASHEPTHLGIVSQRSHLARSIEFDQEQMGRHDVIQYLTELNATLMSENKITRIKPTVVRK